MAWVKSVITKQINEIRHTPGVPVLQYRFLDHIIRNEHELFRIRQYIKNNPVNWYHDKFYGNHKNVVTETAAPYGNDIWTI
jgi:hypothetical protein